MADADGKVEVVYGKIPAKEKVPQTMAVSVSGCDSGYAEWRSGSCGKRKSDKIRERFRSRGEGFGGSR
ncbi:MAG: hypothetical protein HFH79_08445 [Lachnospiraceae bacterium]|nr:hypothetical protein [Lachnospiraceae bacterium]